MDERTRRAVRIRELRKARSLTLEMLAELTGRSVDALSKLERGATKKPSLETLDRLATGFRMPLYEFLAYIDDPDDTPRRRLEREIQDLCRQLDDEALELVRGQVGCVVAFRS